MTTKVKLIAAGVITPSELTLTTASAGTNTVTPATTAFVQQELTSGLAPKATIASPTFTGTPSAPTAAGSTTTTQLATTAFVQQELTTLIGGAPSTLNDLNELAAAINDDANYNSTLTTALATKLPLAGGTMTGAINAGANNISNINNTISISFLSTNGYWTGGTQRINGSGDLVNIGTISSGNITAPKFIMTGGSQIGQDYAYLKSNSTSNASLTLRKDSTGADSIDFLQLRSDGNGLIGKIEGDGDISFKNATLSGTINSGAITTTGTMTLPGSTAGTRTIRDSYTSGALANQGFLRSSGGNYWGYGTYQDGSDNWKSAVSIALERSVFAIDEDTAYWSHAPSQTVAIGSDLTTQPTKKIVFDLQNGKVGIGTTTPDYKLEVEGASGTTIAIKTPWAQDAYGQYKFATPTGEASMRSRVPGNSTVGLEFYTYGTASSTAKMSILGDGKVGIGTDNPTAPLQLNTAGNTADGTYYSTFTINNTGSSTWSRLRFDRGGVAKWGLSLGTDDKFKISNLFTAGAAGSPNDNVLVIDNNSKIGIGTDNPATNLHVSTTSSHSEIRVSSSASGGGTVPAVSLNNTAVEWGMGILGDNHLHFRENTAAYASRLTIADGGNVGIGTTSPTSELEVNGQIKSSTGRVTAKIQDIFHIGGEDWTGHGQYGTANGNFVHVTSGTSTPYYAGVKVTGSNTFLPAVFIPYSIGTVMKMAVSIYCLVNDTSQNDTRYYAGNAGYDKDFNFLGVDGIGTYQYNLMSNQQMFAGNRYERDITLKGWQGSGATDANKMDAGTVYIRPMLLCNYQRSTAQSIIEGFTIMPAGTVADNDSNAGTNF